MNHNNSLDKLNELWAESNAIKKPITFDSQLSSTIKIAHLFASGRFFFFTMDFTIVDVDFVSENTEEISGITKAKFNLQSWLQNWHEDDYEIVPSMESCKVNFLFEFIDPEEITNYKICQKYRLKQKDGSYRQFLNQTTTLALTENNKIQKTLLVQMDINHLGLSMSNRVSFVHMNGGKSYYSDDLKNFIEEGSEIITFSEREREILGLTSKGMSVIEIAEVLFISKNTVDTHRRNILNKTDCSNMIEVISNSIRKGWI